MFNDVEIFLFSFRECYQFVINFTLFLCTHNSFAYFMYKYVSLIHVACIKDIKYMNNRVDSCSFVGVQYT